MRCFALLAAIGCGGRSSPQPEVAGDGGALGGDAEAARCDDEDAPRPCGIDVGACAPGSQRCEGGAWGACLGGIAPAGESCNAEDDDCDGAIDETCPWVESAGGAGFDAAHAIAALPDGGAIVVGRFQDVATFGAGEARETTLVSLGGDDAFVARYAPTGVLEWAVGAGGSFNDWATGVAIAGDGGVLVSGMFGGVATFGAGSRATTIVSEGEFDAFVARFEPTGAFAWVARSSGSGAEEPANNLAADGEGRVVIVGGFGGAARFGAGEATDTSFESSGDGDVFVAAYDPSGALAWAVRAGGPFHDLAFDVAMSADGGVLVTGVFSETAVFGDGDAATSLTSDGLSEVFLARLDSTGALAWAVRAGGAEDDFGRGVAATSDGGALVAGSFGGVAVFGEGDPGESALAVRGGTDAFMARYTSAGALAWAIRAGGIEDDFASGIVARKDGFLVTGGFSAIAVFGAAAAETTLDSDGGMDVFVAAYDADGVLASVLGAGGPGGAIGYDIAALDAGGALVAGSFSDEATFFADTDVPRTITSSGASDVFVAHYPPSPP
ncbi:MAG: hypothetical protein AABZ30_13175 [Myxococcota bacterium]